MALLRKHTKTHAISALLCNHQGQNYFVLLVFSSILVAPGVWILVAPVVWNRDPLQIQSIAVLDPFPQTGPDKVDLYVSVDNLKTEQKVQMKNPISGTCDHIMDCSFG